MTIRTICHMIYAGTKSVPAFVYGKEQAMEDGKPGIRALPKYDYVILIEGETSATGPLGSDECEDKLDEIGSDLRVREELWVTVAIQKNGVRVTSHHIRKGDLRTMAIDTVVDQLWKEATDA